MNYIKEINSFYDWLMYNPLPTGAIALWHALIAINNKAGWAEEFTVANVVIQSMTGLSRQGVNRARNTLIQKGLIEYKKGTSNQAGKYKIISLECKKIVTEHDTKRTQSDTQGVHKSSTLNKHKLNKTINIDDDDNRARPNFVAVYEQEFGQLITPGAFEQLNIFIEDGLNDELISEAIRRAAANGVFTLKYVTTILRSWQKQGVTNMAGVIRADEEFKKQKERGKTNATGRKNNTETAEDFEPDISYYSGVGETL